MDLKPIHEEVWDDAVDVLTRGFPDLSNHHWQQLLERLRRFNGNAIPWPLGYLLKVNNNHVGVMLAFQSDRDDDQQVVNLSYWYIDEDYRWYAPIMLRKITRSQNAIITDLTPTEGVVAMLPALDYEPWNNGALVSSILQSAVGWRPGARIIDLESFDKTQLSTAEQTLLRDHDGLGCVACILQNNEANYPLIFSRRIRRRVAYAHLIYAPSRKIVLKHLATVCLYLLRKGYFLVGIDCFKDEAPRGSIFVKKGLRFYNGSINKDRVDYAYSELVLFERFHAGRGLHSIERRDVA